MHRDGRCVIGEFVCPLDPDDRYAETFLQEALAAHHHTALFCPVVCTDQFLLKNGEVMTATTAKRGDLDACERLSFTPAGEHGWHWSSTSSLMLRRSICAPHSKARRVPMPSA